MAKGIYIHFLGATALILLVLTPWTSPAALAAFTLLAAAMFYRHGARVYAATTAALGCLGVLLSPLVASSAPITVALHVALSAGLIRAAYLSAEGKEATSAAAERELVHCAHVPAIICCKDGVIEAANEPAHQLLKCDQDLRGEKIDQLDRAGGWIESHRALDDKGKCRFDAALRTGDRSEIRTSLHCRKLPGTGRVLVTLAAPERGQGTDDELSHMRHQLREREKELDLLYQLSRLPDETHLTRKQTAMSIINRLPAAFQNPTATEARIRLGEHEARTPGWSEDAPRLSQEIAAGKEHLGTIEVCLRRSETSFLPEEEELLAAIALQLGRMIRYRQADAALHESKEYLSTILHSLGDGVIATDAEGRVDLLNPAAERLTGWPSGEAMGRPLPQVFNIWDNRNGDPISSLLHRVLQQEQTIRLANDTVLTSRCGEKRQIADSAAPICGSDGEVRGATIVFSDVTEQHRIRRALQKKTEELETYFNLVPEPLCIADTRGRFLRVNRAWAHILGYSEKDLEGQKFLDFIHPEDLSATQKRMAQLDRQEGGRGFVNRYLAADGSYRYIEWNSEPHGTTIYAAARDITDRKEAEEALGEELARQELAAELSGLFLHAPVRDIENTVRKSLQIIGEFAGADRVYANRMSPESAAYQRCYRWCAPKVDPLPDDLRPKGDSTPHFCTRRVQSDGEIQVSDPEDLPQDACVRPEHFSEGLLGAILCVPIALESSLAGTIRLDGGQAQDPWKKEDIRAIRIAGEIIFSALERSEARQQINYLTFHDELTGLHNRNHFERRLLQIDGKDSYPLTFLSADVDGLKIVNDTMGHAAGDELLQICASILHDNLPASAELARLGGDEFGVILPCTTADEAEEIAGQIGTAIHEYNRRDRKTPISISLGFATAVHRDRSLHDLRRAADQDMYRNKLLQQGTGRRRVLDALMAALAERDHITQGHAERMQRLCQELGKRADLNSRQLADLGLLAQVHDLGKVGVPDRILFKPGPLNDEEWEEMRQHCEKGYRVALSDPDLAKVADLILKHHERWDGTGYPLQISGEDIPIECRILSIVDAYDAMTNDRPYRSAMSEDEARRELVENAGSQFDPHLVRMFLEVLDAEDAGAS